MSSALIIAQDGFFRDRSAGGCVADNGFCPDWIVDNLDRYWDPFSSTSSSRSSRSCIGFAIALALGLLAHRRRWLITPLTGITSAIYTIPSPALFLLLLPITGRGNDTAIVALTAYTQVIIFRNVITGLNGVPEDIVDAAAGMGMTPRQRL